MWDDLYVLAVDPNYEQNPEKQEFKAKLVSK
jgi:hypothetical protein